jgi:DNA-binding transcriptional LysR family regulator
MSDYPARLTIVGANDLFASRSAASYAGVVSFLAVVKAGSFSRAGARLGIGRCAVSRNVHRLEAQLHVRLFVRTKGSASLTREGRLFYYCIEKAVLSL